MPFSRKRGLAASPAAGPPFAGGAFDLCSGIGLLKSACTFGSMLIASPREPPIRQGLERHVFESWQSGCCSSGVAFIRRLRRRRLSALAMAPVHAAPILFLTLPALCRLIDGASRRRAKSGIRFQAGGRRRLVVRLRLLPHRSLPAGIAFFAEGPRRAHPADAPSPSLRLRRRPALFTAPRRAVVARLLWSDGPTRIFALAPLGVFEMAAWPSADRLSLESHPAGCLHRPSMAQAASVVGVYGLTFAGIAVFAAPALFYRRPDRRPAELARPVAADARWCSARRRRPRLGHPSPVRRRRQRRRWWLAADPASSSRTSSRRSSGRLETRQAAIDKLVALRPQDRMTRRPAPSPFTEVVWPETALPFFLTEEPTARRLHRRLLSPGTLLFTGARRASSRPTIPGGRRYYNSLFAITILARHPRRLRQ